MPHYKLVYFNLPGRGEAIRMLFALRGQAFEDYRVESRDWPGVLKEDTSLLPLGQLPVLLIDGKPIPQSGAIKRHLAREFGLYGANNAEAARIDVVCCTVDDIVSKMVRIIYMGNEEEKARATTEYRDKGSKPLLTFLNDAVKQAGGKFFVGNTETLADVDVYVVLDYANHFLGETFIRDTYPYLAGFHKTITENSKLSNYIRARSDFVEWHL